MNPFLKKDHTASMYALLAGFLYGLIGYFGMNIIHAGYSVFNMLFWRFLTASIVVLAVAIATRTLNFQHPFKLLKMFLSGTFLQGTASILYFIASTYIGTGLAMVIFFTFPAFVLLINWLWGGARPTRIYFAALFFILVGLALLIDPQAIKVDLTGIVIGIFSALAYGLYVISSKNTGLPPLTSTLMVSGGTALLCLFLAYFNNTLALPNTGAVWGNILALSTLCTALPILLVLEALKTISTDKASMLLVLEPIFVVIFGVLLLNEHLTPLQGGGIIILLAGALFSLAKK